MDILNTYTGSAQIQSPSAISGQRRDEIRAAAEEFEAVFIAEMLRPVFNGQEVDKVFGGGEAEKSYRSLLVDEYGKEISKAGGLGIADTVERELLSLQEVQ